MRGGERGRPQAAIAVVWRQSLSRLWALLVRRHSDLAAALPRRRKRSMRRLKFVSGDTRPALTRGLAVRGPPGPGGRARGVKERGGGAGGGRGGGAGGGGA